MLLRDFFTETPYASALCTDYLLERCSGCFDEAPQSNLCPDCRKVTYCSPKCLADDRRWHECECKAFQTISKRPKSSIELEIRLLGRLLARQRIDKGVAVLSSPEFPSALVKDRVLGDLLSHERDFAKKEMHEHQIFHIQTIFRSFFEKTSLGQTKPEMIRRWSDIGSINGFSITALAKRGRPDTMAYLGEAIYLNASRFNHSCKPSLVFGFNGNRLTVKFVDRQGGQESGNKKKKTISKKEFKALTFNYGFGTSWNYNTSFSMTQQRIESLKARYFFKCQCELCRDRLTDRMQMDSSIIECRRCGVPYVWRCRPRSEKAKLVKMCRCPWEKAVAKKTHWCHDADVRACARYLNDHWKTTMSTAVRLENLDEMIESCEPFQRLASQYWNHSYNIRLGQLCEKLFEAYWKKLIVLLTRSSSSSSQSESQSQRSISVSAQSILVTDVAEVFDAALTVGETMMSSYSRYWEPFNLAMAIFAYRLASLYRLRKDMAHAERASFFYLVAAEIWKVHGDVECQTYFEEMSASLLAAVKASSKSKSESQQVSESLCS